MKRNEINIYPKEDLHVKKEKLQLYKQTLQLFQSKDWVEQLLLLKKDLQQLREEVSQLKEELAMIKNEHKDVTSEGKMYTDEASSSHSLNSVPIQEPISYRKLSNLLKSMQNVEENEQDDNHKMEKDQFDIFIQNVKQQPYGMKPSKSDRSNKMFSRKSNNIKMRKVGEERES